MRGQDAGAICRGRRRRGCTGRELGFRGLWTGQLQILRREIGRKGETRGKRTDLLVPHWLPLEVLFVGKAPVVTVCDAPEAVFGDLGGHEPVIFGDDEVGVPVVELVEVVIDLVAICQYGVFTV